MHVKNILIDNLLYFSLFLYNISYKSENTIGIKNNQKKLNRHVEIKNGDNPNIIHHKNHI